MNAENAEKQSGSSSHGFSIPRAVVLMAQDAWNLIDPSTMQTFAGCSTEDFNSFRDALGKLPFKNRKSVAEARAGELLGSAKSEALWEFVAAKRMDPVLVFVVLCGNFSDALAPVKELALPKTEQIDHFDKIKKLAMALAVELDGSIYDQGTAFLMKECEVSLIVETVRADFLLAGSENLTTTQTVARAFLTGLRPSDAEEEHFSRKDCFERVLRALPSCTGTIQSVLSVDERIPTLAELLRRLAARIPSDSGISEFGKNPRSLRAPRKAFAKTLRDSGRAQWGRANLELIQLAVALLFDETLAQEDLFR